MLGIELSSYAAELARISVWISEIQWMRRNGFEAAKNPILRTLNTIENRDAVLNTDGTKAEWPTADVVIGNPPFLGNKKMISELGEEYIFTLRKAYAGTPGGVDLVAYWFVKAWEQMSSQKLEKAGFVCTNSIRGGVNRDVLKPIVDLGRIFEAWSDETWTVDGASVRVSLVSFDCAAGSRPKLDGVVVKKIHSDLTAHSGQTDITQSLELEENRNRSFIGRQKDGPLDVQGDLAREMVSASGNPHGRSNAEIIRPWRNGMDLTRRPSDRWLIDFMDFEEREASLFEAPFEYARKVLKPIRAKNRDPKRRTYWWRPGRTGIDLRAGLSGLSKYIISPRVSKHRLFVWVDASINPDSATVAIARDDDTSFGILHSSFHEIWSLRMGTFLGVGNDPRYTPSTTFETFPFPEGLTPNIPAADYTGDQRAVKIAVAAASLNKLRENWLNPDDLVDRIPEVVPGYPDRILPKDEAAAKELKKRILTNLYNARPRWLEHAHEALDEAVAEAYGWGADWRAGLLTEDEILARLFDLNQTRAKAEAKAAKVVKTKVAKAKAKSKGKKNGK
ncbi:MULTISPECIES: class I SAM-dependent DNA methyltransferase [unclassified Pseudovibrio]|uniref:class I SAM-dependent DNA methyltransferase n=1 Tax=unclassified Pseudovibrio TaxID=2627060 RepID=UPI000B1BFC31|nr:MULTISPECIES: DNA methyltransferase [unclassified Pseudovibrio]